MTAGKQVDPLNIDAEHAHRTSLKRFVTEKWGVSAVENNDEESEDSEGESASRHFRTALSNAALKLRFPLRNKDRAPDSVCTADSSDDDTDDGRFLIAALSKTATTISSTLRRTSSLIKTSSQRSLTRELSEDTKARGLQGTEICGNSLTLLHRDCGEDSSTSSLDSSNDSTGIASSTKVRPEKPDGEQLMSTQSRHAIDHKRRPTRSKTISSGGQSGHAKRTTGVKISNHDEKEEKIDDKRKESCRELAAATENLSPKASRRTAPVPGKRGVARTRSLHADNKHREQKEHRVTRSNGTIDDKGIHNESHGRERRRGVHRSASLPKEHKGRESRDQTVTTSSGVKMEKVCKRIELNGDEKSKGVHGSSSLRGIDKNHSRRSGEHRARYAVTLETTGSRNEPSHDKVRGIARSKSHDVAHMYNRADFERVNPQWH